MFHVITPLARYENIQKLIDMLEPKGIQWYVITDASSEIKLEFDQEWIHHFVCPNEGVQFFERSNFAINWFLSTQSINLDDMYCVLNDDDSYEEDLFEKLKPNVTNKTNIIICSMDRGHNIPAETAGTCRAHPTSKLLASSENLKVGSIGIEQVFIRGRLMQNTKIPLTNDGDGHYIVDMINKYGGVLVPDAVVLFNYFEPGRWNMDTIGSLIDKLTIVNIRIWTAEDIKRDKQATDKTIADATKLTNVANSQRNDLIQEIDEAINKLIETSTPQKLYKQGASKIYGK